MNVYFPISFSVESSEIDLSEFQEENHDGNTGGDDGSNNARESNDDGSNSTRNGDDVVGDTTAQQASGTHGDVY